MNMNDTDVEGRFDGIDAKLAIHDARFDSIDAKLATHDARLDDIDAKLATHDARFDQIDKRFTELHHLILQEGERTRKHFDVVAENLKSQTMLIAEGHSALRDNGTEIKSRLESFENGQGRLELPRL
jgi:chromosome segregation ATPase